ncbi:hypothetical protein D9M72_540570 [compost metagenome]
MHVDVDERRVERDRQHRDRIAAARDRFGIGGPDRRQQQLVLHRAAIDEDILLQRVAAIVGRHAGKAGEPDIFACRIDFDRVVAEILAEHLGHARQTIVAGRREFQRRAVAA